MKVLLCVLLVLAGVYGWVLFQQGLSVEAGTQVGGTRSSSGMHVLGAPTVSAALIDTVLSASGSPAAGKGQALYDLGSRYGIDPVFALAFFMHESSFGTAGEARASLSLGNVRCLAHVRCQDGYAWFDTWEEGFEAWYMLIRNVYVAEWGLVTVEQIIPTYAPSNDHNDVQGYIASVEHAVLTWRSGQIAAS